jgi:putative ABC transport system permease protein
VPLLLVSLKALFRSVTSSLSITIPFTINYAYAIGGFIVIYLTYEASKALSRKKINRISMSEVLKSGMD